MPELPEVETVRRGLEQATRDLAVTGVLWLDPRMVREGPPADAIAERLPRQIVRGVERRGKFMVWRFVSGDGLLLHLGMSGRLYAGVEPSRPLTPHTHLVVLMADGRQVRLRDPRRFGRIAWVSGRQGWPVHLGPDALSRGFCARYLAEVLKGRQAPIKALLLDQRVVAGVGNIYADESLFRAGIDPTTPGGALSPESVKRLHRAVRSVLRAAIRHRGTTFLSFEDTAGHPGGFAARLAVYGREGAACRRCGSLIRAAAIGGRTTHFCPICQRREARAWTAVAGEPTVMSGEA
jgi:formamidopyrimidine-DNA glycosylase